MKAILVTILFATSLSQASEFFLDGKKITKGEAILALAKNPQANVVKQDRVILNMKKGTLKTAPKNDD